jgi:hypothetical protein
MRKNHDEQRARSTRTTRILVLDRGVLYERRVTGLMSDTRRSILYWIVI